MPDQIVPSMLAELTMHSRDFLLQRMKSGGNLGSAQADALEADLVKKFAIMRTQVSQVKSGELPAIFSSIQGPPWCPLCTIVADDVRGAAAFIYIQYLQCGATMRLQRAAMK